MNSVLNWNMLASTWTFFPAMLLMMALTSETDKYQTIFFWLSIRKCLLFSVPSLEDILRVCFCRNSNARQPFNVMYTLHRCTYNECQTVYSVGILCQLKQIFVHFLQILTLIHLWELFVRGIGFFEFVLYLWLLSDQLNTIWRESNFFSVLLNGKNPTFAFPFDPLSLSFELMVLAVWPRWRFNITLLLNSWLSMIYFWSETGKWYIN